MARQPQVAVIASPSGATLSAPRTNTALDLAETLAGVSQPMNQLLQAWGKERAAEMAAKAEADALASSGTAFRDAVREGKIEKTQNPWYIQAYEQRAAQVRAQGQVADLASQAQTWAERSDPQAFAARLNAEVGRIGQGFQGIDQAAGFQAAAGPILQQQLAANTAYNVARIQAENEQNVSTLVTKQILDTASVAGGRPDAASVWRDLEPLRQQWLGTGGTEDEWNMLVINSTIAAGANSANSALLNILNDNRGGKGTLANIAGPDGQPVATTLMTARYRIEQEASSRGMSEIRARQNAVKLEGEQAVAMVTEQFGYDFLAGKVNRSEIFTYLEAKGVSAAGAGYAIEQLSQTAAASTSLARAQAGGDPEVLELYTVAARNGLTSDLQASLTEKVARGEMDVNEAQSIIGTAMSRSNAMQAEARADARSARSDARADAREARSQQIALASGLKDDRERNLGLASTKLQKVGDRSLLDPQVRARVTRGATDAGLAHLAKSPGDYQGAAAAQNSYLNQYINTRIQSRRGGQTRGGQAQQPGTSSSGNPRR